MRSKIRWNVRPVTTRSMATLILPSSCGIPLSPSHLPVEGRVPSIAIVDTRACSILVYRKFVASIARLDPLHLKKAPMAITACGQPSRPIGLSTIPLEFILANGAQNRTKFLAKVIVMDTDAYGAWSSSLLVGEGSTLSTRNSSSGWTSRTPTSFLRCALTSP